EIEREEDLGVTGVRLLELKRRSRYVVLDELAVVLDAFDAEKRRAEDHRDDEKHHQHLALAELRGVDRQRHRQAAGDEHNGVDGAERDVELVAGGGEGVGIPAPVDGVRGEQAAEEEHFGDQKHPHAERRRLALLREAVELMGERRMMGYISQIATLNAQGPAEAGHYRTCSRSR